MTGHYNKLTAVLTFKHSADSDDRYRPRDDDDFSGLALRFGGREMGALYGRTAAGPKEAA